MQSLSLRRRTLVAGAAACAALPAAAQRPAAARAIAVAQIVDVSTSEQDVAKDFLIGARAAWQDLNARGGVRGRPVQHLVLEVDGSAASVRQALSAARAEPSCVALFGTVSDPVAAQVAALLKAEDVEMAHAAPWLQNASADADERTLAVFASRRQQIAHALKSLSVGGMHEVGAVFASPKEARLYRADVAGSAEALRLKLTTWTAEDNLLALGQRLGPGTPAVLLFIGGTPEAVQFTRGLDRQARQRYVIAMADVNLQNVQQMGGGRSTPVIATQAVPMVTAALPLVRRYREVMARLFDEPPVALSLAGFIAAQYTHDVLADTEGVPTRASALAAFQRKRELDLGGFRISLDRRGSGFVTQSMLTADGRVVG